MIEMVMVMMIMIMRRRRMNMITMAMLLNVIDDDDNGYVGSLIDPKGFDKDVIGMMTIINLSLYGDNDDDL